MFPENPQSPRNSVGELAARALVLVEERDGLVNSARESLENILAPQTELLENGRLNLDGKDRKPGEFLWLGGLLGLYLVEVKVGAGPNNLVGSSEAVLVINRETENNQYLHRWFKDGQEIGRKRVFGEYPGSGYSVTENGVELEVPINNEWIILKRMPRKKREGVYMNISAFETNGKGERNVRLGETGITLSSVFLNATRLDRERGQIIPTIEKLGKVSLDLGFDEKFREEAIDPLKEYIKGIDKNAQIKEFMEMVNRASAHLEVK